MDPKEFKSVASLAKEKGVSKVWLCPRLVTNTSFNRPSYLAGIECSVNSIPEEIKERRVTRYFHENNTLCIIWENN